MTLRICDHCDPTAQYVPSPASMPSSLAFGFGVGGVGSTLQLAPFHLNVKGSANL
jgi:hypothetical protein